MGSSVHSRRLVRWIAGLVAVLAFGTSGSPRSTALRVARADQLIPSETYRLPNGLQIILHEDHRTPFIAVQVTYHFGPLHEPATARGTAHLVEHLFDGTSLHLQQLGPSLYLTRLGGVQVGGKLGPDHSDVWSVVPSANLEPALWAESDRMGFLLPAVATATIAETKKELVTEERLRLATESYAMGDAQLQAALFPASHPYHVNWVSVVPTIDKAEDLAGPMHSWYAPSNATLTLAGDFVRAHAGQLIDKYFATLPVAPRPQLVLPAPVLREQEVVLRQAEKVAGRPRLRVAWLLPALGQPGSEVGELVTLILDRGRSGRLAEELVHPHGLALDVQASRFATPPQALLSITAHAERDTALPHILTALDKVVAKLASTEVSAAELGAVKRLYQNTRLLQLHDILKKAQLLQSYNHSLGKPDALEEQLARSEAVTATELQKFVREYLTKESRVVLYSTVAPDVTQSGSPP